MVECVGVVDGRWWVMLVEVAVRDEIEKRGFEEWAADLARRQDDLYQHYVIFEKSFAPAIQTGPVEVHKELVRAMSRPNAPYNSEDSELYLRLRRREYMLNAWVQIYGDQHHYFDCLQQGIDRQLWGRAVACVEFEGYCRKWSMTSEEVLARCTPSFFRNRLPLPSHFPMRSPFACPTLEACEAAIKRIASLGPSRKQV